MAVATVVVAAAVIMAAVITVAAIVVEATGTISTPGILAAERRIPAPSPPVRFRIDRSRRSG
jgi:hypothetical protein